MSNSVKLVPAQQLVATNRAHYPNESTEYRSARNQLLVEEIGLRRHIEHVAAMRRALPIGGEIAKDFEFISDTGPVFLSSLFGDKDTLMIYSMMYGQQRKSPCPSCTSFLSAWNGIAINLRERIALMTTARSPIDRIMSYKRQRRLDNLPFFSDMTGEYTRAYVSPTDEDIPGFSIFNRSNGVIRHFYSGELSGSMADPGQDPRGAPDLDPLWLMLDLTPEGRGTDWYPKLEYRHH